MTATDRLERDLATWLHETAAPAVPDYTDAIVRRAVSVPQPPRWAVLERWIPMSVTTLQPVRLGSPVPWRTIALVALLALALVAGVALVAAGRPTVPAPFGLASNGLVAYARGGDIFTVDPVTGDRRTITTGLDEDGDPRWSPDGSRIAFLRGAGVDNRLAIVDATGGNPVTSEVELAWADNDSIAWSPDGRAVAIAAGPQYARSLLIIDAHDGSARNVGAGYSSYEFFWRPPDGGEILFAGLGTAGPALFLYSVASGEAKELPVVLAPGQIDVRPIGWTADGTRYAYQVETGLPERLATMVVDLASGEAMEVPVAYGHISNDGTRIAGLDADDRGLPCVALIDGGPCRPIGTMDQAPEGTHRAGLMWSPDDRFIVTTSWHSPRTHLLDPEGAVLEQPAWLELGAESWQRRP